MSNSDLVLIEQREVLGKDFRIYGSLDNPLFLAKDVAEWIEYDSNKIHDLVAMVDDNEKLTTTISWSGQRRKMWFLTEDGLYEILMQSRKPIAKEFKRQVKRILKDIRKHGIYASDGVIENLLISPDFGIRLLKELKEERQRRAELQDKVEQDKPMVTFANAVEASESTILIGDLAKILKQNGIDIGQKRLFDWLRKNDYLMKVGNSKNMPTQRSMEMGIFEVEENIVTSPKGNTLITKTTRVTGKGQIYFINLFSQQNIAVNM